MLLLLPRTVVTAAATDPWCPGGITGRCPCPGASLAYKMNSYPSSAALPGSHGFTAYESTSPLCSVHGNGYGNATNPIHAARSSCLPRAEVVWKPDEWQIDSPVKPTKPPGVSHKHLERACEGLVVHVARPHWVPMLRTLFSTKYAPKTWTLLHAGAAA